MGDDEAETAKLSWLPSLVCEKAASLCVCVVKVEHWVCNVNKCHVIFAEALCRLGEILMKIFLYFSDKIYRRAAFSQHYIISEDAKRLKRTIYICKHTEKEFNTGTDVNYQETLHGVKA